MSSRTVISRLAYVIVLLNIGALVEAFGGIWDITHHSYVRVDTFFTTQHVVLYTGVALLALTALLRLLLAPILSSDSMVSSLLRGLNLAVLGTATSLVAGPFDFWWHSAYGFDPVLFSPPHVMLIPGLSLNCIGALIGSVSLLSLRETGAMRNRAVTGAPLLL